MISLSSISSFSFALSYLSIVVIKMVKILIYWLSSRDLNLLVALMFCNNVTWFTFVLSLLHVMFIFFRVLKGSHHILDMERLLSSKEILRINHRWSMLPPSLPLFSLPSNLWNHSNTTGIDFHQSNSWKVAVVAGALYINWLTEINFQVVLISEFEK